MSRFAAIVTFAAVFLLAGCRPPSANPKLVGTYMATNGESLIFLPNTRVLHVPMAGGQVHIGFTRPVRGALGQVEIFAPDTSPFIGTRFEIDTNFTTITVHWDDPRPNAETRQIYFQRKRDG